MWDRVIGFVPGSSVTFLSPALWGVTIGIVFALMAAAIVIGVLVYRRRRWTPALATANAVVGAGVIVALIAAPGAVADRLLNRVYFDTVIPADSAEEVYHVLTILTWVTVCGVMLWGAIDAFLKARRSTTTTVSDR